MPCRTPFPGPAADPSDTLLRVLDPSLILCENCGYDIGSLEGRLGADPHLKCPECAKPITASLPEHRTGSEWQRAPGALAALRTIWRLARSPVRSWSGVRVDTRSSVNLMLGQCLLTAALVSATLVLRTAVAFGGAPPMGSVGEVVGETLSVVMYAVGLCWVGLLVLLAMCAIEAVGIRTFGARRGWRVSWPVAWTVVGHASGAWLLCPILLTLIWAPERLMPLEMQLMLGVAALALPLLAFETLVYLGFRAMRFANAPR